jgi:hypothetical protein
MILFLTVFALGISLGPFSYAQEEKKEKTAEDVPPGPKAGQKVIPEDYSATLNTSFYSKYVWRGYELSKDSLVIFPSATIGYKGFAFNMWGDFDTKYSNTPQGDNRKTNLQETDLILTYSNRIKPWKLDWTVGWIYYHTDGFNANSPTRNQELFGTLSLDVFLRPTLSVYSEIQTGSAWYVNFSLSHNFKVYRDWSLGVGGWVSYRYSEQENNYSAMHDGNLWAGLTIPLTQFWSVTPKIQYSFPLSSAAQENIRAASFNGNSDQFVYGGLIFERKF